MMSSAGSSLLCSVLGSENVSRVTADTADDHSSLDGDEVNNVDYCTARLALLLDSGKLSDVTLIVGSRRYRCHRLLHANASSVLE